MGLPRVVVRMVVWLLGGDAFGQRSDHDGQRSGAGVLGADPLAWMAASSSSPFRAVGRGDRSPVRSCRGGVESFGQLAAACGVMLERGGGGLKRVEQTAVAVADATAPCYLVGGPSDSGRHICELELRRVADPGCKRAKHSGVKGAGGSAHRLGEGTPCVVEHGTGALGCGVECLMGG